MSTSTTARVFMGLQVAYANLHTDQYFFFINPRHPDIYTLSLHDALPIYFVGDGMRAFSTLNFADGQEHGQNRSEEHTSELQSRQYLVCRLLLGKKKFS